MANPRKVDDSELTDVSGGSTSLGDIEQTPNPQDDGPGVQVPPPAPPGGGTLPEEDNPGGGFENMEQSE